MIQRFLIFLPLGLLAVWVACIDLAYTLGGWVHLLPFCAIGLWVLYHHHRERFSS